MLFSGLTQTLTKSGNFGKVVLGILVIALIAGLTTGYGMSKTAASGGVTGTSDNKPLAKSAKQDSRTFRDFAEGTIQKKNNNDDYSEGTHVLVREKAVPVALTSSVVDLNQYIGKKVKVYGETQKAIKEGWLMDVGRVDEE